MKHNILFKGLRFGMLLQLAIGPMCLLVFQTSAGQGIPHALLVVLAIAVVDALYIALSCFGVATLLHKERVKAIVKWIGCLTLVIFGLNSICGAMQIRFLPALSLFAQPTNGSLFLKGFVLTASNPLTILFWGGVFSAQMAQNDFTRPQLFLFAAGCVLSTLVFLSFIAVMGGLAGSFLSGAVIRGLNILVGAALIAFGLRLLLKKDSAAAVS